MRTQVILQFPKPPQRETLLDLARHGAKAHKVYVNTWVFPGSSLPQELEADINSRQINCTTFYEFKPTPQDSSNELAAYLWLGRFEAVREQEPDLMLARSTDLREIIASAHLARELSSISPEITWRDLRDQEGFMVLNQVAELPDPISVPHPVSVSEGEDEIWAVQSDGREFITQKSFVFLMAAGIANPARCVVNERVLHWRRGLVFGGNVLKFLMENEVVGMPPEPSFLTRAGSPG
ncbi:hypothetical protein ACF08W_33350 [Streptomyces sp. NPDC015144]|uniref:hypothetical protein n=1 Tax=Streptomyces sp. NPDC015144 TaxID=3364944 RepID=UPI0036FAC161